MRRRRTKFGDSLTNNVYTREQYFNRLMELSMSMFEWKNMPDTIDTRFLELTLFTNGNAIFFKDEVLGFLCLPMVSSGNLNVYRNPINRRAYADNGYNIELNEYNSVIIYNNMLRTNSVLDVRQFAKRLENLDRIVDVNANAQKTPILIKCSEQQRLTLKNLYQQYDGNEPVIYAEDGLDTSQLTVLKTDAPYICDKVFSLKTQIWNEALTYLGISNVNVNKKERLISDEVLRNQGGTIACRYSRLSQRQQACEQINKMFDLNTSCEYREDFSLLVEDKVLDDEYLKEGANGE